MIITIGIKDRIHTKHDKRNSSLQNKRKYGSIKTRNHKRERKI
jgi:hypothetical protein